MAEKIERLYLPAPDRRQGRGKGRMPALLLGLGLLGCAGAYGAWMYFSVQTPIAVIDTALLAPATQSPAQIAEVLAQKNDRVTAGQVLIRFHTDRSAPNSAEAGAQDAAANPLPRPAGGMEESAQRAAEAQAAGQDLAGRIMQARALEEEASREVQRKAEEHAVAQLEVRRLDALGERQAVPPALHEQARNGENDARQKLEQARATREEYSGARAAAEGELFRIKAELAAALADVNSANSRAGSASDRMRQAAPAVPDIVAPADAVVIEVVAQPGMWAQPQQQLILLMPDTGPPEATAWFPEKDGANIQPGQLCRVFIPNAPEKSFSGRVEHILPAGSPVPNFLLAGPGQAQHIAVRIRLSAGDAGESALQSGMRVAVRVHTLPFWEQIDALRLPFLAQIGALAEKLRGK